MQSQQSVLLNCALTATMHGRTTDDIVVTALPGAHVYGNVAINSTFLAGGTVILMERFTPGEALRLIEGEHATLFEGVPAMYSMMLADPGFDTADLSTLRAATIGGQTFAPELLARWQKRAPVPVLELWGMTELSGLGTTHAVHAPRCPVRSEWRSPASRSGSARSTARAARFPSVSMVSYSFAARW